MEFLNELQTAAFWSGLLAIIWVNIILSGDNAVVIALAARSLPVRQQKQAVMWGAGAAVVLRIILTIVAVELLRLPWLRLIGGVLLFWIAIKLLVPEDGGDDGVESSDNLWAAIKTILIADLVMSLDNVIAVAAVAKDSFVLLDSRACNQHPAGDLRRDHADETNGALADHHQRRGGIDRLRGRRNVGDRPGGEGLGGRKCRLAALGGAGGGCGIRRGRWQVARRARRSRA